MKRGKLNLAKVALTSALLLAIIIFHVSIISSIFVFNFKNFYILWNRRLMTQEDPDTEKTERAAALYTLTSTE